MNTDNTCKTCLYFYRYADTDEFFCCTDFEPRDANDSCEDWDENDRGEEIK